MHTPLGKVMCVCNKAVNVIDAMHSVRLSCALVKHRQGKCHHQDEDLIADNPSNWRKTRELLVGSVAPTPEEHLRI